MQQIDYGQMARSMWEEFERINFGDKRNVPPNFGNMQREVLDLSIARNVQEFRVHGDFLYADSDSTGVAYVQINGPTMPPFPFRASTGIHGFPYRTLSITNAAQAGLILNLWYGYGAKIIPPNQDIANIGTIATITNPITLNGWNGINRLGSPGFFGTSSRTPASQMQIELRNPVGSGITILVDSIRFSLGTAGLAEMRMGSYTALANLEMAGVNKNVGGSAAGGTIRYESLAGAVGTLVQYLFVPSSASVFNEIKFEEPVILSESEAIHIRNPTAASNLTCSYEWREV